MPTFPHFIVQKGNQSFQWLDTISGVTGRAHKNNATYPQSLFKNNNEDDDDDNNTCLMVLCPGKPKWASIREVKSVSDLGKQETMR